MYQRDYILCLIEQFVKFLVRIVRLKESREYEQALLEIGDAYRTLLGLPPDLVHEFSDVDLLHFLRLNWTPERCEILASLLKEEGDNLLALGNDDLSVPSYIKSLSLFLELSHKEEQIAQVLLKLKDRALPNHILRKLFPHYEAIGRYADAENILFELAESQEAEILQEGCEFYARLKQKSTEDLKNGNLPAEELDAGLKEFTRIANRTPLQ